MKPRNKTIVPMLARKQGPHGKTFKAMRRQSKVDLMRV
jgi:hypothetical protein